MSICESGIDSKAIPSSVSINVTGKHPLIKLAQSLPWREMCDVVLSDLKNTPTKKWWLGRKMKVRIHLGVYLLQQMFNKTDRQVEYDVHDNAAYQLFCGRYAVDEWHVPDHTKIEKFRSRLRPETQQTLANIMVTHAIQSGYGNFRDIDIDSTIQEANMTYPSDAAMLKKLGAMAHKTAKYLNAKASKHMVSPLVVNMKRISARARKCFFLKKNASDEEKKEIQLALLEAAKEEIIPVANACEELSEKFIEKAKWNYARTIKQIKALARNYLEQVAIFFTLGKAVPEKPLSFHLKEVACFSKGKPGKKYQFGRAFQLGRLTGNFLFVAKCNDIHMVDKKTFPSVIATHEELFGEKQLDSVATDKGYYSRANEKLLLGKSVNDIGIQRPSNIKRARVKPLASDQEEKLANRRSGIEPLIGHAKHSGQLGRSRMKNDRNIEASGYTAILGFNMRQLVRCLKNPDRGKLACVN
jgi:hypothetical protein